MATQYRLTYKAKERRWRKKYKGREYRFGLRKGETKATSYPRVLAEWKATKAQIDATEAEAAQANAMSRWEPILTAVRDTQDSILQTYGDTDDSRAIWQELEDRFVTQLITPAVERGETPGDLGATAEQVTEVGQSLDMARPQLPTSVIERMTVNGKHTGAKVALAKGPAPWDQAKQADTVQHVVDAFIRSVRAGNTQKHADDTRAVIMRYVDWLGDGATVDDLFDNRMIGSYFDYVKELKHKRTGKDLAPKSKKAFIAPVGQLCRWAFARDYINQLPRIIAAGNFNVESPAKEIEIYSDDEFRLFLTHASERQRLYLLLSANCGMTQKDISDLLHSEVDMERGVITRKRSKTSKKEGTPTIDYQLWPETLVLLRKFATQEGDRLFAKKDGGPLVGEARATDTVKDSLYKLRKKLQGKGLCDLPIGLQKVRRTTASKMNTEHPQFKRLLLGRAPDGVDEKHYIRPDQAGFNRALSWLRDALQVEQACS